MAAILSSLFGPIGAAIGANTGAGQRIESDVNSFIAQNQVPQNQVPKPTVVAAPTPIQQAAPITAPLPTAQLSTPAPSPLLSQLSTPVTPTQFTPSPTSRRISAGGSPIKRELANRLLSDSNPF
jgi:hypothetical protein